MSLHGYDIRNFGTSPSGAVMTTGGSFDLPLNTLAIASVDGRKTTKRGLKVLDTFKGIDKDREFLTILFGSKKTGGRYGSDKSSRSIHFNLKDVKKVTMFNPKVAKQEVDYFRIGWDGINDDTTFKFNKGQTIEIGLNIGGIAATFLGSGCNHLVKTFVTIPNAEFSSCKNLGVDLCEPVDCREHTIEIVKNLREYLLPGGYTLKEFLDINPIFKSVKENPTPIKYKQYCLEFCGSEDVNELYNVAAQYPGVDVKRDSKTGKIVIFQKEDAPKPEAYKRAKDKFLLKGCGCPEGYEEVAGGKMYIVRIEDDGEDKKSLLAALPNAVAGTERRMGGERGFGQYSVILTKHLTAEQEKAFVDANVTATILFTGDKQAFCECGEEVTYEWEECGTCEASCATYRIMLPDSCERNRLEDLQSAFPDLEITQVDNKNCLGIYETKVETGLSCDTGCSPDIIQQVFEAKAPKHFEGNYWYPVEEKGDEGGTLCGIEIKAKPILLNPSECLENDVPFISTSTRIISVFGGSVVTDGTWNVVEPVDFAFSVKQLSRAKDLDNLFGSEAIKGWQKRGRFYFENVVEGSSNVEKALRGDVHMDNLERVSGFSIAIERPNMAGINHVEYNRIQYTVFVPFGKTDAMEKLLGELASAAGVPFEIG